MSALGFSYDSLFPVFAYERKAHERLRDLRWPVEVACPLCGHHRVYETKLPDRPDGTPNPRLQWKCAKCRRKFSVTPRTFMEGTRVELRRWLQTIRLHSDNQDENDASFKMRGLLGVGIAGRA